MVTDIQTAAVPSPPATVAATRPRSLALLTWLPSLLAVGAGAGFWALTTWMAFARYAAFETGRLDLEIYTQVVWNIANGHPFATTLLKTNLSHLAEHVALVLVPIAGLYRLLPDPRLLLALQQVALALLGWPLFVVARRALGSGWAALVVLVCFYLTPSLAGVALDDFHAVPIAALPLAVGTALVLLGRPRLGAGIALLALVCEEETALFVIGLGALLWLRRERWLGVGVAAAAAAYLGFVVLVLMPSFHDQRTVAGVDGNRTVNHFAEIHAEPARIADRLFGERGRDAAVRLALPTAGLGLLAPSTLLPAAPSLAALLLQDRDDTFGRHWVTPLLVGLWLATALGLARLRVGWRNVGLAALVVGTLVSYRLVSPLPGGGAFDPGALAMADHTRLLRRAVERIPSDAVVVASPNLVAHLANRPEAYVFPIDSHYAEELGWRKKRPDFYALDLTDDLTNRATNSERLNPLNADRPFNVWSAGRKVLVLSDAPASPTTPLDARWADRLLLKGFDQVRTLEGTRVILYWERYGQLRGRYDRDLTVLDRNGSTLLYEEDMALSDLYGSNKWQPGQTIMDEVLVPPSDGPVTLRIAWVAQDKRSPFLLADGSKAFDLTIDPSR